MALHVFSDSIGAGVGASTPSKGYASLLAAALSLPLVNHSVSGDQASDQATRAKTATLNASDVVVISIGTNDTYKYGADPIKREYFKQALTALIAWSALPNKIMSRSAVMSGSWLNDDYSAGIGMWSNTPGSTQTFKVSGTSVYVGLKYYAGTYGTADILVDGQLKMSVGANKGGISTQNNAFPYDQDGAVRIDGLTPGEHSVQVKVTGGTGTPNVFYVQWCAGSDQIGAPAVFVGDIINMGISGYAGVGGSLINTAEFNVILGEVVAGFADSGAPVSLVALNAVLNTTSDLSGDGAHPLDVGHLKESNAFYYAIVPPVVVTPPTLTFETVQAYRGSDGVFYIGSGADRRVLATS